MVINEHIKTEVKREYDVAVCGGGFAGISAALAAARQGSKVVLFEKQYMLGGLGTAGIVTIYLPLCDGLGRQVSFGIAEELLHLSILHGAEAAYPKNWLDNIGTRTEKDQRFYVQYNPQLFAILVEKLLMDEGVDILYGIYAVGVDMNDGKINHIITENKSGRFAYKVKSVVDATGDCDIAHFSGAPTENFKQGNVLAAWYYSVGNSGYKLNQIGAADIPDEEKTEKNKIQHLSTRKFSGLDGEELSQQMCMSHRSTYADFLKKRQQDSSIMPVTVATTPQIRMTRKIVGEYELAHTEEHKYFDDSIGMVSNWKKRGPVYEVPFGTLYNSKVKNLICAGRCTSVNETLWDVMRVIPCCAVTGQAAGTAAAMTDDFSSIDIKELQKILKQNGVVLHEENLK
ncbi:MAG: FAD-dependent oxidoreductase [Clostridia bacterium]|nr:FAD-dependent oxidoreductase [Clostridia bacterium]MBR6646970.1 FAD-dependent oxidoreductase [Clostridia bacterium]